ncbi:hypothetical protein MMC10_008287 [Thelotrema lepadinum]|nr:hypothetical protein [Thelotrema lepadinum]
MELYLLLFGSLVLSIASPIGVGLRVVERLHRSQKRPSLNGSYASISNTQPLTGVPQCGNAVQAKPLCPKVKYEPDSVLMHQDGGNTGSVEYDGPLGPDGDTSSINKPFPILLWHSDGRLTGAQGDISSGIPFFDIIALDPKTFEVIATWTPPIHNDTLSVQYMELKLDDDALLVTSVKGKVFVVHRKDTGGKAEFTLTRSIDLAQKSILKPFDRLLNGMFDSKGNIWWTTGSINSTGAPPLNDTVVGYISPDDEIAWTLLENQKVENGIAVSGTTVYVVTGPSGPADHIDAEGYMYAFSSSLPPCGSSQPGIEFLWRNTYPAGSRLKPGGFARGSGATPTLLGNSFVTITDNNDTQVSMLVYPQELSYTPDASNSTNNSSFYIEDVPPLCSVPLFSPNASGVDIAALSHMDENGTAGVLWMNTFNGPLFSLGNGADGINGAFNNLSAQAAGITRVDVVPSTTPAGGVSCSTRWTLPLRMTSVPVLSLKTGLVYGYTQDEDSAKSGNWVWYIVAIDWASGDEVWRVRTGAGGLWNDGYLPGAIGPDATFYQAVLGGIAMFKDGNVTLSEIDSRLGKTTLTHSASRGERRR